MKIICQKQFNEKGNYSEEDIQIFNHCIANGIKELKNDWRECKDNQGIYLTETDNELIINIKVNEVNFKDIFHSLESIIRDMLTVVENYGVPYHLKFS